MSGMISRLNNRGAVPDPEPRVLEVGQEDADDVLDALSSGTSRALFETLYDDPSTPSEVADRVDTSLQNVHYHLENLEAAGLVEPVDTVYSDRGNEMTVFGPASDPIVLVGERREEDPGLAELAGGVGALALASLLVQAAVDSLVTGRRDIADVVGPASRRGLDRGVETLPAGLALEFVEPGVLFFLGGLLGAVATALWLRR